MSNLDKINKHKNRELLGKFYLGISRIFYELGIDGQDFVDDFINQYITYAYGKNKRKSAVILATGFTRYFVENFLKNPHKKTNSRKNFYESILFSLKELSEKSADGFIPISGGFKSFNHVFYELEQSGVISSKTFLESLVKRGFVEKKDNKIKFVNTVFSDVDNTQQETLEVLCELLNRLSHTLMNNLQAKSLDETLYQITCVSRHIHPDRHKEITGHLRNMARRFMRDCQKYIDSHEEKEEFMKKHIEDLNSELGLSMFIFDNETNEE